MENQKEVIAVINDLNDLEKVSSILRSLSITLTGELVVDSDEEAKALITKENDNILKKVYANVGLVNDKITDLLSPSSLLSINETKEEIKKDSEQKNDTQKKLFEENKNHLKLVHSKESEKTTNKEENTKHTVEQKVEENSEVSEETKRYKTEEEAINKIKEEIKEYLNNNPEVVFTNKLPSDVKAAMKHKILNTVPADSKLAELNDKGKIKDPNLMGNTLSNIAGELFKSTQKEKLTDGAEIANNEEAAEELKKQVVNSTIKNKVEKESKKVETIETPEETTTSSDEKEEIDHFSALIESTNKDEIQKSTSELLKACETDEEMREVGKDIVGVIKKRIVEDKEEPIKQMFNQNLGKQIKTKKGKKVVSYVTNIVDFIIEEKKKVKEAV